MPAKGYRIDSVNRINTKLQERLAEFLRNQSVQQAADEMGIPYWVVRDTLRGSTDCPRGLYIPGMARGLGITADQLLEDAYAPVEAPAVPVPA